MAILSPNQQRMKEQSQSLQMPSDAYLFCMTKFWNVCKETMFSLWQEGMQFM